MSKKKPVDLDLAADLSNQGMTNREIAAELGVSPVTLWKAGWRKPRYDSAESIDWEFAQKILDKGGDFANVAAHFGVSVKTLRRYQEKVGVRLVPSPRLHDRAPAWKGGVVRSRRGYVRLHLPDHPDANPRGYVLEHRLVMERKLGRRLLPEEVVHHINQIKDDNREENLELFASNADHLRATRGREMR